MTLLEVIGLSILPISELRGGISLGIAQGFNPFLVFIVAVLANIIVIPILLFFLDHIHGYFYNLRFYRKLFDSYVNRSRRKIEHKIGTKAEFWTLMLFVGIPLPITGVYTGTILAWVFNLNRKKVYKALILGALIAGVIVTLITLGFLSLF